MWTVVGRSCLFSSRPVGGVYYGEIEWYGLFMNMRKE
jgi:hypothetical protein